jgi:hypothetical protein
MSMDDLRADGEPDAGPLPIRLRGKKRVKDSAQVFLGNPLAGVTDGGRYASPTDTTKSIPPIVAGLFERCPHVQLTAGWHGIDGISE